MSNLMKRHVYEKERHRKLIDKREKVDAIIQTLREQNAEEDQIKEVEDILSPVEKLQMQKLDAAFRKFVVIRRVFFPLMKNRFSSFLESVSDNFN
jgi:hypothetical protein